MKTRVAVAMVISTVTVVGSGAVSPGPALLPSAEAALGAAAKAETRKYEGTLTNVAEGQVVLKARFRRGRAVEIAGLTYSGLPATCTVSPPGQTISGTFTFRGVRVRDNRRFRGDGETADGASFVIVGRFSAGFGTAKGTVQATNYFPPEDPPEETCESGTEAFSAGR